MKYFLALAIAAALVLGGSHAVKAGISDGPDPLGRRIVGFCQTGQYWTGNGCANL